MGVGPVFGEERDCSLVPPHLFDQILGKGEQTGLNGVGKMKHSHITIFRKSMMSVRL